jgi:hypothetical protein
MAFFSPDTSLLASCSCTGDVTVRQVSNESGAEGDAVPIEALMLTGQLPLAAGGDDAAAGALVTLAWHPSTAQILAAAAGNAVYLFEVPLSPPAEVCAARHCQTRLFLYVCPGCMVCAAAALLVAAASLPMSCTAPATFP